MGRKIRNGAVPAAANNDWGSRQKRQDYGGGNLQQLSLRFRR